MKLRVLALSILLSAPVFAQTAPPQATPPPPKTTQPIFDDTPQLSDAEKDHIENLNLKAKAAQDTMFALQQQFSEYVQKTLNPEHPGWQFDPRSSTFIPIKKNEPAKPEVKK